MKLSLILIIVFSFSVTAFSHEYFEITFNLGFNSRPTFTKPDKKDVLSFSEATNIFKYAKDSTGIEYRYSYAGCENRTHALSLLLTDKQIKHYKIWNYDPALISLFNKSKKLTIENFTGLTGNVEWVYHVAILIFVEKDGASSPMVIDPSLRNHLLSQKEWLALQNSSGSYFTHLDSKWYNFNTLDKVPSYGCDSIHYKLPPCLNILLTGDFYLNNEKSLKKHWVEEALAVNKVAMKIVDELIIPSIDIEETTIEKLKILVKNYDKLKAELTNESCNCSLYEILKPYKQNFNMIKKEWIERLNKIRK